MATNRNGSKTHSRAPPWPEISCAIPPRTPLLGAGFWGAMKTNTPDYGTNGKTKDGLWVMHPSGDLVTNEEKEKRLSLNARARHLTRAENEIFGMSWKDLEFKQGGRIQIEKGRISSC